MDNLKPVDGQRNRSPLQFLIAVVLAAAFVLGGAMVYLARDLPDKTAVAFEQAAAGFSFAFGSGQAQTDHVLVDGFANGYALLSSGPVKLHADSHRVLEYTWNPSGKPAEFAFFWRQKGKVDKVNRTDISAVGTYLLDLSMEPDWQGEIIEFGFLVAGSEAQAVKVGPAILSPDSLNIRWQLMWQAWSAFEERSQQSINFLQGGDDLQLIPLPLLLMAWLLTAVLLLKLLPKFSGGKPLIIFCGVLFLTAWVLLDIRWTINNIRQVRLSLQTPWQADEKQRMSNDLDGEIYQYAQRLKSEVLGNETSRILIIGDGDAIDYYLLRAKYHLLPHSVHVAGRLSEKLSPQSLNFVIFFGQEDGITKVPGWNARWRKGLKQVDRGKWGVVYKTDS